ncbi:MAG: pantoate--beta-alanine ligase [Bacteroidota bacterium]
MQIFKEIGPLKLHLQHKRKEGFLVGLVPTMGALHEGHLSLIHASKAVTDITVCSLFVNPTQFNNPIDLEKYPRTPEKDISLLESAGCDVLFAPETSMMYERPGVIHFDFGQLDKVLEGKFRPGHFSGVATVVSKLFHIVEPDQAFFGQKDYQQLQIVTRLGGGTEIQHPGSRRAHSAGARRPRNVIEKSKAIGRRKEKSISAQ